MGLFWCRQCCRVLQNPLVNEDKVTAYVRATGRDKVKKLKDLKDLRKDTIEGAEIKFDDGEPYWEVKFPVWQELAVVKTLRKSRYWVFHPVLFPIIMIGLIAILTRPFISKPYEAGSTADQTLSDIAKDLSFLFGILLSLIFTSAVAKGKESKKLYAALCGDVKALAIWVSTLSDARQKYKLTNDIIKIKAPAEVEYTKIRLLLSIVAPVAKHVIRQKDGSSKADSALLDDKYRVKISRKNMCGYRDITHDDSQRWSKATNPTKQALFKKIEKVQKSSKMDLFEVVMYCLLDEIHNLQEKEYGFGQKVGLEKSLIGKWQDIYGSWGTVYSLSVYKQPLSIRISINIALIAYTCITVFAQDSENGWIRFWLAVSNVLPYILLWCISLIVEDPFSRWSYNTAIRKDARDTQQQVSLLMSNRVAIDNQDYAMNTTDKFWLDLNQKEQERYILKRVNTTEVEEKENRKQTKPIQRQKSMRMYKTVNF